MSWFYEGNNGGVATSGTLNVEHRYAQASIQLDPIGGNSPSVYGYALVSPESGYSAMSADYDGFGTGLGSGTTADTRYFLGGFHWYGTCWYGGKLQVQLSLTFATDVIGGEVWCLQRSSVGDPIRRFTLMNSVATGTHTITYTSTEAEFESRYGYDYGDFYGSVYMESIDGSPTMAAPPMLYWYGDGVVAGGGGDWTAAGTNWFDGSAARECVPAATLYFSGSSGGTVTLGEGVSANRGIKFATTGYTLDGSGLTLGGTTGNAIDVFTSATATIESPVAGSHGLQKTGLGTLVLAGANPLSGTTTVVQGTVVAAHAGALSASPATVAPGATLAIGPQIDATVPGLSNNGLVDVRLGRLTVTAGLSGTSVANQIIAGIVNGGAIGITSSDAASTGGAFTVGWLDNGDGSFTFGYAAAGDTNLDNVVDLTDLLNTVGGGKYDTSAASNWSDGDANYDGVVDLTDLLSLVGGGLYDQPDYNPATQLLVGSPIGLHGDGGNTTLAAVPEPSTWVMCLGGLACAGWASRRRRAA